MSQKNPVTKILIMAGGTGGHVFPALTIAELLMAQGVRVEWLGTRRGLEARVVPSHGIPLHFIRVSGLRGKSVVRKVLAPFWLLLALLQALLKLIKIRPNCVLGMGGFVTGPGGIAAWLLGKPLVLHEQNAIAGFTNQLLHPLAASVMEGLPGAFDRKREITRQAWMRGLIKPGKTKVIGNPVREAILRCGEQKLLHGDVETELDRPLQVLVVGGSLGAAAINQVVPEALAMLHRQLPLSVLHQCGSNNLSQTSAWYEKAGVETGQDIRLVPFIEDMATAYGDADIVVCRAGAITVSELAVVGLASILVPLPIAVDDHQTENARILQAAGAAVIVPQQYLDATVLAEILKDFARDRNKCRQFGEAARKVARTDAAEQAVAICLEACHG